MVSILFMVTKPFSVLVIRRGHLNHFPFPLTDEVRHPPSNINLSSVMKERQGIQLDNPNHKFFNGGNHPHWTVATLRVRDGVPSRVIHHHPVLDYSLEVPPLPHLFQLIRAFPRPYLSLESRTNLTPDFLRKHGVVSLHSDGKSFEGI